MLMGVIVPEKIHGYSLKPKKTLIVQEIYLYMVIGKESGNIVLNFEKINSGVEKIMV
jgi:hypothetical protein